MMQILRPHVDPSRYAVSYINVYQGPEITRYGLPYPFRHHAERMAQVGNDTDAKLAYRIVVIPKVRTK